MNLKKNILLTAIFMSICYPNTNQASTFGGEQMFSDRTTFIAVVCASFILRSSFNDGRKEMRKIEKQLSYRGISVRKKFLFDPLLFGFLSILSLSYEVYFEGFEYNLNACKKEIDYYRDLHTKELVTFAVTPSLIQYGWRSGSRLFG